MVGRQLQPVDPRPRGRLLEAGAALLSPALVLRPRERVRGVEPLDLPGLRVAQQDRRRREERLLPGIDDADGDQVVPARGDGEGAAEAFLEEVRDEEDDRAAAEDLAEEKRYY